MVLFRSLWWNKWFCKYTTFSFAIHLLMGILKKCPMDGTKTCAMVVPRLALLPFFLLLFPLPGLLILYSLYLPWAPPAPLCMCFTLVNPSPRYLWLWDTVVTLICVCRCTCVACVYGGQKSISGVLFIQVLPTNIAGRRMNCSKEITFLFPAAQN